VPSSRRSPSLQVAALRVAVEDSCRQLRDQVRQIRHVTIPAFLLPDVIAHLTDFTAADPCALIFTGSKGAQLRRSNFTCPWKRATALAARSHVERMTGIEPALSAWEADVLPLNYIRRVAPTPS
jgi:hypothetical protein